MHILYQEIQEQPGILQALLAREAAPARALAERLRDYQPRFAMIVARGTSDNAAMYGKYLLESFAGLPVALAAPSLYTLYARPPRLEQALVIGISQSGQSPDLVAVMREARRQGALTVAVVNERESPMAEVADHVLWCGAGTERAVAASKSFTAQQLLLALLTAEWSGAPELAASLSSVPQAVAGALTLDAGLGDLAHRWRDMGSCLVLARGYAYAAAMEVALKIKETSYVMADAYSGADFLHGPIAVVEPGFPVLLLGASGPTVGGMCDLAITLRDRGADTVTVTNDPTLAGAAGAAFRLTDVAGEALAPISLAAAGQLLAYHLAVAKGYDPDQPRGLRKVTNTR
ncbi:MAG TPA: SIS domain-containing protein [Chloroflexota bacterium]|nr:SIS domain-containing protein [Chloroflexota bacterium]